MSLFVFQYRNGNFKQIFKLLMSAHLNIFKLYLKTTIQTVVVFSFISSSVVCFILCPANESFCEWRYSFEFVVLMAQLTTPYRQKPYA